MAPAGNNQSAQRAGASGDPINPNSIDGWLLQHEQLAEAERLARLDQDRELVEELREAGFAGLHWNYYATELVKYGLAVLTAWTVRGVILEKVRRHAFGGLQPPLDDSLLDREVAASLAGEVVAVSLTAFRNRVLIPGVWDPAKGASIKTFFIGQCLKQFPNIYKRWHHETYGDHLFQASDIATAPESEIELIRDVATSVSIKDEVRRVLSGIKSPLTREVFVHQAAGRSAAEIAEILGTTEKAVTQMIYNERKRIKEGKAS